MKLALFVGSLLVLLAAGCGDKPSAANPVAEVRGEPIASATPRSNSATAAAAAPATVASSATGVVATTFAQRPSAASSSGGSASSSPAAAAAIKPAGKADAGTSAYPLVGFDKLAGYTIEISDDLLGPVTNDLALITAKTDSLIPDSVKSYSKKHVSLRGFMLPLKVEGGLVTELLIMKDQSMCCYGTVPKIHEWVSVKMSEKGVKPVMDQPVTLFGTLHVGEMRENGYLTGIYSMDGERMAPPEE